MRENITLAGVLLVVIVGAALYTMYQREQEVQNYTEEVESRDELELQLLAISDTDFTVGSENPRLRLLVYTDGDCPFCKRFEPVFDQLMATYPEDVAITYRHFKLPIYPDSYYEHIALECVGMLAGAEQYRAFQNEVLLEQTGSGVENHVAKLTQQAVTYVPQNVSQRLTSCIQNEESLDRIEAKVATGNILGVRRTPTAFFISDDRFHVQVGSISYETLVGRINNFMGQGRELIQ